MRICSKVGKLQAAGPQGHVKRADQRGAGGVTPGKFGKLGVKWRILLHSERQINPSFEKKSQVF